MLQDIERQEQIALREFHVWKYSGTDIQGHAFSNPCCGLFIHIDTDAFASAPLQFGQQHPRPASNFDSPSFRSIVTVDKIQPVADPPIRTVIFRPTFDTRVASGFLTDMPV